MPDILSSPVNVVKTIKTRAPFIGIENPEAPATDPFAGKFVDFNCAHALKLDGKTVSSVNAGDDGRPLPTNVRRAVKTVAAHTVTVTDPITGQPATVSVAGVALILETLFAEWYAEDAEASAAPSPATA